ncbi:hypothetical protein VA7868_02438 [Vibrio aerogenes CECT 7868]|uniref:Uncharacterized protein n=1 Tax=Vibrio aerogenes CECT 7868 TaxID=1216006 RepID=A0A1M5Z8M2_9VIBR|nr:hypothetical protein [Vibrio aerogenes]SHI20580.1 hypothetical protein VA7868_02438 [Vibrio aerogenes CECT 7868]
MAEYTDSLSLTIRYDPHSPVSIEAGLADYRHYLKLKSAFKHGYCQIQFEVLPEADDTIGLLSRSLAGQAVFDYYRLSSPDHPDCRPEALLSETGLTPETVFFLRACQFPGLQQALYETAQVICQVSRQMNDPTRMRLSERQVAGGMALFMIGLCYPRYAYLLGSFIVPYWDSEHLSGGEELPALLVSYLGYTRETLKVFCYCDNPHARARMFSPESLQQYNQRQTSQDKLLQQTSLLNIFRTQPDEFAAFKSILTQRFAEQPYLQDDDPRYYLDNPLDSFLLSVLYPYQDEDYLPEEHPEQTLDVMFIDSPAREVASTLKAAIEQALSHPIGGAHPLADDIYCPDHYVSGSGIHHWKAFITGVFEQGDQIWAYIDNGNYPDVPACVTAFDIRDMTAQKHFALLDFIRLNLGPYDSLNSEIVPVLQGVLDDWCKDSLTEEERGQNQQKLLRLLDVIHRWNQLHPFPAGLKLLIVDDYQVLSEPEFMLRYHGDWAHLFTRLVKDISDYRGILESAHFKRCYALVCACRDEAEPVIRSLASDDAIPGATMAALLAGIVHHDRRRECEDAITAFALDYLNRYLPGLILEQLAAYSAFPLPEKTQEHDSQMLRDYRYLAAYLSGEHEAQEDVIDRMNCWLDREQRAYSVSDTQIYYQFLNDFEEDSQKLLVSALVVGEYPASPVSAWCSRFLSLWLNMAPGKVCRMLGHFFLDKLQSVDRQIADIEMLTTVLAPHGLKRVAATAYLLESVIDALEQKDDIRQVLAPFFARYLREQVDGQGGDLSVSIEPALKLIKPLREQIFYIALQSAYPALKICYFDQALLQLLSRCLYQQMMEQRPDEESLPEKAHADLEHFIRLMELPVLLSPRQIDELLHICERYQLIDFDTPYGQTELTELLWYASPMLRANVLKLLAARPSLGLDHCYNERLMTPEAFCRMLPDHDIRQVDLLSLILSSQWYDCLPWFAANYNIHELIDKHPLKTQLEILRSLAAQARQRDFVDGYPDALLPERIKHAQDGGRCPQPDAGPEDRD